MICDVDQVACYRSKLNKQHLRLEDKGLHSVSVYCMMFCRAIPKAAGGRTAALSRPNPASSPPETGSGTLSRAASPRDTRCRPRLSHPACVVIHSHPAKHAAALPHFLSPLSGVTVFHPRLMISSQPRTLPLGRLSDRLSSILSSTFSVPITRERPGESCTSFKMWVSAAAKTLVLWIGVTAVHATFHWHYRLFRF